MNPIKTIIVEDDPQIAEIQSRFISRVEHFELVGIAHTLEDAADLVDVFSPDLILLDIHFEQGNGVDFMWQIRQKSRQTDFILITAAKEAETLQDAIRGGAFDYILKPMNFTRFQGALESYKQFKHKLDKVQDVNQNDVDELMHTQTGQDTQANAERMPKNIDAITVAKIKKALDEHQNESISAEELGQIIGMSRTTARRYLEYLVTVNSVTPNLVYGSVGRPERLYFKCS